jgi:hypothetical protein
MPAESENLIQRRAVGGDAAAPRSLRVEDRARDHVADHRDCVRAAWISSASNRAAGARKDTP